MTQSATAKRLRTARANALVAFVFLFAQMLFAAHDPADAGDLNQHAGVDCVFCLAAPQTPDPDSLAFSLAAPVRVAELSENVVDRSVLAVVILKDGSPRAPPALLNR